MINRDTAYRQAQEQFKELTRRGVTHFPVPAAPVLSQQDENPQASAVAVRTCTACSLHVQRKNVVHWPIVTRRPLFILADFPDEPQETQFQNEWKQIPDGRSALLWRLFERLGVRQQCYLSYAVKCVPHQGIPSQSVACCALHVTRELRQCAPAVVLCFGERALASLTLIDSACAAFHQRSQGSPSFFWMEFSATHPFAAAPSVKKIGLFPSLIELEANPTWRQPVWNQLLDLRNEAFDRMGEID